MRRHGKHTPSSSIAFDEALTSLPGCRGGSTLLNSKTIRHSSLTQITSDGFPIHHHSIASLRQSCIRPRTRNAVVALGRRQRVSARSALQDRGSDLAHPRLPKSRGASPRALHQLSSDVTSFQIRWRSRSRQTRHQTAEYCSPKSPTALPDTPTTRSCHGGDLPCCSRDRSASSGCGVVGGV